MPFFPDLCAVCHVMLCLRPYSLELVASASMRVLQSCWYLHNNLLVMYISLSIHVFTNTPYSLELLISARKEEICLFSNLLLLNSFLDQHRHKIVASAIYFIEYVKHETVVFFHETGGTRLFKMVYYVLPRQSQLVNGADLFWEKSTAGWLLVGGGWFVLR
jgi:hypothetical protein